MIFCRGDPLGCLYILLSIRWGYLGAKSRAKQVGLLDKPIQHHTVHLLFNNIPLILMGAKAIGDMQTILHRLNTGVKQDELIGVTEPFLKIVSR